MTTSIERDPSTFGIDAKTKMAETLKKDSLYDVDTVAPVSFPS